MYVDRIFEGETSKPWEGGSFGYVRNAMRINDEVILTKFHEGIDIAPVNRDRAGNPLDLVSSIADGRVVHISPISGRSNYGKYVVVEHQWENSSVYSLYAHLAEITCKPGDPVRAGSVLGRMGYTGAGINRTRAHLHLELAMLMSRRFDDWQKAFGGGINHHGNLQRHESHRHRCRPVLHRAPGQSRTPLQRVRRLHPGLFQGHRAVHRAPRISSSAIHGSAVEIPKAPSPGKSASAPPASPSPSLPASARWTRPSSPPSARPPFPTATSPAT